MARRRYLVMYDIRDDGRLRRVHDIVKAHGDRLQYSVYICDLSPSERVSLRWQLEEQINSLEDAVALLDLGELDRRGTTVFEFLGVHPTLPHGGATVI